MPQTKSTFPAELPRSLLLWHHSPPSPFRNPTTNYRPEFWTSSCTSPPEWFSHRWVWSSFLNTSWLCPFLCTQRLCWWGGRLHFPPRFPQETWCGRALLLSSFPLILFTLWSEWYFMKANLMMLFPSKYFKDSRLPHICTYIYIYVTIHIRSTKALTSYPSTCLSSTDGLHSGHACGHAKLLKSCLTLCNLWTVAHQAPLSMEFPQARTLEWVAMPSSRGSSWPRDQTRVSHVSCTAGGFSHWATGDAWTQVTVHWSRQRTLTKPLSAFLTSSRTSSSFHQQLSLVLISPALTIASHVLTGFDFNHTTFHNAL